MPNPLTITIGRAVQTLAALRGGGSALPGLVVEKLEPAFAATVLGRLPLGVVLVSGTNGKTTTVKVVTELLEASGLRVFTNNTGSNFMRGVISSLLRKVRLSGRLDADIAVLELDEAHAVTFVEVIKPRYALLLNVMADQMDRFGEIDYTAQLLTAVAKHTTGTVVLNREDARLAAIAREGELEAEVRWFGLGEGVRGLFFEREVERHQTAEVAQLVALEGGTASFSVGGEVFTTSLLLKGMHNAFNGAAALALVQAVVPNTPVEDLVRALGTIKPAFGRGESLMVDGQPLEIVLVKNPDGFRMALKGYDPAEAATMIVINDEFGDGRDVSWLYDVSFAALRESGVALASGNRAFDLALRLEYDEVPLGATISDLSQALDRFLADNPDRPRLIYTCYTGMLALRKLLANKTKLEKVQ